MYVNNVIVYVIHCTYYYVTNGTKSDFALLLLYSSTSYWSHGSTRTTWHGDDVYQQDVRHVSAARSQAPADRSQAEGAAIPYRTGVGDRELSRYRW